VKSAPAAIVAVNANQPKCRREPVRHSMRVDHTPGIITISNANTTIGYCRYDESGVIEYVFVSTSHRRRGYAKRMLAIAEQRLIAIRGFQPPISPLGEKLVESHNRRRPDRGASA
jgi:GNAT superfamily N-acetyltransferase